MRVRGKGGGEGECEGEGERHEKTPDHSLNVRVLQPKEHSTLQACQGCHSEGKFANALNLALLHQPYKEELSMCYQNRRFNMFDSKKKS